MRKNVFGRRLRRDTNERKALFKGLMSALVLHDKIQTTEAKAKAIRSKIEKLVTKANKKGKAGRNLFQEYLTTPALEKLISDVAPRFAKRPGGYTRTTKLDRRVADNAPLVLMEWVEMATVEEPKKPTKRKNAKSKDESVEATVATDKKVKMKTAKKNVKKEEKELKKGAKK